MYKITLLLKRKYSGASPIVASIMMLLFLLFTLAITEGLRLYGWEKMIEHHLQSAILAQVTNNYQEVYSGVKKKSSAAFTYDENTNSFEMYFDPGNIMEDLADDLHLSCNGTTVSGTNITIENLQVEMISAGKEINSSGRFITKATVDITIYFQTVFRGMPPYKDTLHIEAKYLKKF